MGKLSLKACDLKNVMNIPELTTNLLSVGAIADNNGEVTFMKDKVTIKHLDQAKRAIRSSLESAMKEEASLTVNGAEKARMWHRRFGQIHRGGLKRLTELTDGLDIKGNDVDEIDKICDTCLKAKQTRKRYRIKNV